jgi:hypothetical protein
MLDWIAARLDVSTSVAAIVVALVATQLALQVYALVDLARRGAVTGGRKWVWALVIAFGNIIGAIVYLVAGRSPPPVDASSAGATTAGGDAARRAVDALYGPRTRQ